MSDIFKEDLDKNARTIKIQERQNLSQGDASTMKTMLFSQLSQTSSFIKKQALIIKFEELIRNQEKLENPQREGNESAD